MKKIFKNLNKPLLILTIVFLVFGLLMIQSASSMESYMRYGNSPYHYFIRQAIFIILGLIVSFIVIIYPTYKYKNKASLLMYGSIIVLLVLFVQGYSVNNAKSWFDLGFFNFQPSELIKIIIIIYLAVFYEKNINNLEDKAILLQPFYFIIPCFALIVIQPDLGTASIILMLTLLIFYVVPMPKKYKSIFNKLLVSGILLVLLILLFVGDKVLKSY